MITAGNAAVIAVVIPANSDAPLINSNASGIEATADECPEVRFIVFSFLVLLSRYLKNTSLSFFSICPRIF